MTAVQPGGATSKQQLLREQLETLIHGLAQGDLLPAERRLAQELGVARMTLRRVIDDLVAEARLVRRAGSGTFAASTKVSQRLSATSFSADMRARGLRPGSRTVHARRNPTGMMLARPPPGPGGGTGRRGAAPGLRRGLASRATGNPAHGAHLRDVLG
ncbi:MAG TPA: GntR family transcriptional regulator [Nocardioides sp.]|nr:GntR family transcriptional regulator [Nocardioides sp.]